MNGPLRKHAPLGAAALVLTATLLAGCVDTTLTVNEPRANLMPESAARQIIAKYIDETWLANPYVNTGSLCNSKRFYVGFDKLRLQKHPHGYTLWAGRWDPCAGGSYEVASLKRVATPEDEKALADAFVSLGVQISDYSK